jgi:nucleoside-triphosphatase THEP1
MRFETEPGQQAHVDWGGGFGLVEVNKVMKIRFLGPPGVGKTHLSLALGVRAFLAGYSTYFISGHELGRQILASLANETTRKKLTALQKYDLLIIDETGYLPFEPRQATLLFQLVAKRYEKGSIILTSNKDFGQWAEVFGGDAAVAGRHPEQAPPSLLGHQRSRPLVTGSRIDGMLWGYRRLLRAPHRNADPWPGKEGETGRQ